MNAARSLLFLATLLPLFACASAPSASEDVATSEHDLSLLHPFGIVQLPEGESCSPVLAPLALGLGVGAVGLRDLVTVKVTPIEETYQRVYRVDVHGKPFAVNGKNLPNDASFDLTLDNDSHSFCYVIKASFGSAATTSSPVHYVTATSQDLHYPVGPVSVPSDTCAAATKLIARAMTTGIGYGSGNSATSVVLDSATDERAYSVHINGENFVANGKEFENDHEFSISLDNDSASLCLPLALSFR